MNSWQSAASRVHQMWRTSHTGTRRCEHPVPGRPLEPAQIPVQSHTRSCLLQALRAPSPLTRKRSQVQILYWDHSFLVGGGRANWYGFCSVAPVAAARVIGYGFRPEAVPDGRRRAGAPAPGCSRGTSAGHDPADRSVQVLPAPWRSRAGIRLITEPEPGTSGPLEETEHSCSWQPRSQ
jgi:hypothetical protein